MRLIINANSFRKRQKPTDDSYDIIKDLEKEKSIEMYPDPPKSKASSIALKSTIEDIHDRSENEKDTPNKTSMKNVLYEPGISKFYAFITVFCEFMRVMY